MAGGSVRILTTHTGSLPRPAPLAALLVEGRRDGEADQAGFAAMVAAAVAAVVQKQVEVGIDIANDGEQGRRSYFLHMRDRLSGLGGSWTRRRQADLERYPSFLQVLQTEAATRAGVSNLSAMPKALAEVRHLDPKPLAMECARLRAAIAGLKPGGLVDAFVTAPSPGLLACAIRNEYYDSEDSYLRALGAALRSEYEAIVASGFLLQVDCPDLALERHMSFQDRPLSTFLSFAEAAVDTLNQALAAVPRDRVRLHLCWGNYEGPHDCDVPLADILPVLAAARTQAFVLPFATGRHAHEISCFRAGQLKSDQVLVAGVIDTTTNIVEHPETVAERIERAVAAIGDRTRVIAGTDCGFDTGAGSGRVAPEVVWAKLTALSEGAAIASRRLFGRCVQ